MKFKPGKEYQTRVGFKVRLYADDGCRPDPYHGAVLGHAGWFPMSWDIAGIARGSTDHDLMPEKKKIEGYLHIYRDAVPLFSQYRILADTNRPIARKRVYTDYTEGEFDD